MENKKSIIYIIITDKTNKLYPLKKSLIYELKDFKNVKITSFQPSDKLVEWINIASIHLIPQKIKVSNLVLK